MILDSFKLHTVVVQMRYDDAFELWDRAGDVARRLSTIWGELKLTESQPQQQTLKGKGVTVQTSFRQSTVNLTGPKSLDQSRTQQLVRTFDVWRDSLALKDLKRISTRATYVKEFSSIQAANAELIEFNLVRWPSTKVFDQPVNGDLNGPELAFRFEDKNGFSVLRIRAEQIKFEADLDPEWFSEPEVRQVKNRLIIDFDRGLLGAVSSEKFRMDEWIKGFQHVLRRDIEKVTGT